MELEQKLELAAALELPHLEASSEQWRKVAAKMKRVFVEPRKAAVLLLVSGCGRVLLTKRSETLDHHRGQVALPGGVSDPEDSSLEATALREAQEEVGIDPSRVRVIGRLPGFSTFTGFEVQPILGHAQGAASTIALSLNPHEIETAFWTELDELSRSYRLEGVRLGPIEVPTHAFYVGGHRVWGATGLILRDFLNRLDLVKAT